MWFGKRSETITDKQRIENLLTRGVDKIYPSKDALEKVLLSGKRLRIYQGFDPTGDKLHLGHLVGLRKHKEWQDLGHEVIFLIGDGTGQAGDPTGKKKTREKFFTKEELRSNAKDYVSQAKKVINFSGSNPVKIKYNGDWLDKLTKVEILNIAEHFSVQQLIERDMFQERIKSGESINLREFLYPLLQGYDSVAMDVDLELGGSDQTFNMLTGRTLMKVMKNKEKFVMTMPLLSDSKGVKIGKSEGNVIGITDSPNDLFGKIMALSDGAIIPLFTLLTDLSLSEIASFDINSNPFELKKRVAGMIVESLNSRKDAQLAIENFENTYSLGGVPRDVSTSSAYDRETLCDFFIRNNIVVSKTEFRRLISDGAVTEVETDLKIENFDSVAKKGTYKIGKKRFIKIN